MWMIVLVVLFVLSASPDRGPVARGNVAAAPFSASAALLRYEAMDRGFEARDPAAAIRFWSGDATLIVDGARSLAGKEAIQNTFGASLQRDRRIRAETTVNLYRRRDSTHANMVQITRFSWTPSGGDLKLKASSSEEVWEYDEWSLRADGWRLTRGEVVLSSAWEPSSMLGSPPVPATSINGYENHG
jgi:hypothetical protein